MQVWESRLQTTARWLTVALPVLLITGRAAADSALSLAAILFLVRCIATGDWSWTRRTWVRVALGLWIWMLIISNFAYKVGPSYTEAAAWIRFVLFAAAAESWILDKTWIRRLVYLTGAAALFTAGDAILQFVTGHDIFGYPKFSPERLTGPFSPHPEVGIYLARLFFPAVLGGFALAAASTRARPRQFAMGTAVAIVVAAIFLSGERAALILTLLGLLLIVLAKFGTRPALAFMATLAIAGTILLMLNPPIVQRQIESTGAEITSFTQSDYVHLWESGLMMGRNHPLTGVGMHNFRFVCKETAKHFPGCNLHPHNMYVQWLAESGAPGLIGFLILIGVWFSNLRLAIDRSGCSAWLLGPALGVFIQLWPFMPTGSFFSNWNATTFWLILGWALSSARLYGGAAVAPGSSAVSPARDFAEAAPDR